MLRVEFYPTIVKQFMDTHTVTNGSGAQDVISVELNKSLASYGVLTK